jgi:hypothetical protein
MSGEINSEEIDDDVGSVGERIKRLEDKWKLYEEKTVYGKHSDINDYLSLTRDEIESLTLEQAAELAAYFALFSIHLQKIFGKHQARINFCDANLKTLCAKEAHQYEGFQYKERCDKVISFNEYGAALFKTRNESQYVIDRLSYLPAKIEFFARTLDNLQRSRGKYSEKFT